MELAKLLFKDGTKLKKPIDTVNKRIEKLIYKNRYFDKEATGWTVEFIRDKITYELTEQLKVTIEFFDKSTIEVYS